MKFFSCFQRYERMILLRRKWLPERLRLFTAIHNNRPIAYGGPTWNFGGGLTYSCHGTGCDHAILLDKLYHYGIEVFLINYSQIFCTIECSALKYGNLNLHTKGYLVGSPRVVLFRLFFSLFTLTISQKIPLFTLLNLLMILISICQIPVLMFFRQLLTLNYV